MVEHWKSVGGILIVEQVKRRWWNSGIVMVEQCGGKVEQCGWNSFSGTMMLAQSRWNSDAGTV